MSNRGSSSSFGLLGFIFAIAVVMLLMKIAPMLLTLIKIGLILMIVAIIAVVVLVIYFSTHKTDAEKEAEREKKEQKKEEPAPDLTSEQSAILAKGRANLMELRRRMTRVRHVPIRTVCGNICTEAEKILKTLQQKPNEIPRVRQFLNYYLPTLGSILEKYVRLEESGVVAEDVTDNTLLHLIDIKHAMEKQYEALFDDDKLDLTVEMEALKIACLRDGLLTEEDFQIKQENDTKPNLTL